MFGFCGIGNRITDGLQSCFWTGDVSQRDQQSPLVSYRPVSFLYVASFFLYFITCSFVNSFIYPYFSFTLSTNWNSENENKKIARVI